MAKCKVEFVITSNKNLEAVYLVGNLKELGQWNPAKAVKVAYDENAKAYKLSKMLPVNEVVEYKILANPTWDNVEVGMWKEELENHIFEAKKCHVEKVGVGFFKNI